ncbi:MAG: uL13 family ribosomal protein [Candidatus Pacebacteria bacterium]|nr:uL13 family ribosomal protein [Candidatus Paceibacterota bacterium]
MEKKIYTIDATGGKLGRIATKAVSLLIGKNSTEYARNKVFNVGVIINNASKIDIVESKLKTVYKKYSGYPGGLHEKSMEQIIEKKGKGAVLKLAISGMIPHNKLKSRIIRNLVITE